MKGLKWLLYVSIVFSALLLSACSPASAADTNNGPTIVVHRSPT